MLRDEREKGQSGSKSTRLLRLLLWNAAVVVGPAVVVGVVVVIVVGAVDSLEALSPPLLTSQTVCIRHARILGVGSAGTCGPGTLGLKEKPPH